MIAPDLLEALGEASPEALIVVRTLKAKGYLAWCVGGCVRDRLLGRPVGDWDIATDAAPEAVIDLFERAIPTGLQHGTVTVVIARRPIEVTTFRVEEGWSDGRRPDSVRFTGDLHEDLARRDFTINAMAWDPEAHRFEDPHGGRDDLDAGIIRAVGDPVRRFTEDGLRPMRAIRFAATLGLTIEAGTWEAVATTRATFRRVSVERIWLELAKILRSEHPTRGLELLLASGLLPDVLPEAAEASFAALDGLSPELSLRTAALLSHCDDEAVERAMRRLRSSNEVRQRVVRLVDAAKWPIVGLGDGDVRRLVAAAGLDILDEALELWGNEAARARTQSGGAPGTDGEALELWGKEAARALADRIEGLKVREHPLKSSDLALSGRDVCTALGIAPSRKVGRVLAALLERVFDDPTLNTPAKLRAMLPTVAAEIDP